jgi:hypothetical protein
MSSPVPDVDSMVDGTPPSNSLPPILPGAAIRSTTQHTSTPAHQHQHTSTSANQLTEPLSHPATSHTQHQTTNHKSQITPQATSHKPQATSHITHHTSHANATSHKPQAISQATCPNHKP